MRDTGRKDDQIRIVRLKIRQLKSRLVGAKVEEVTIETERLFVYGNTITVPTV